MAGSADGSRLVAVGASIFISTDSGAAWTWASNAPTGFSWTAVASSADGTRLAVAGTGADNYYDGAIYTSTNAGTTWTKTGAPAGAWTTIAASTNGLKLAAAAYYDVNGNTMPIYTSIDGGATWTASSVQGTYWFSIVASADGTTLTAAGEDANYNGFICVSTNSGATWNTAPLPADDWTSVASSADGTTLVAAGADSNNQGVLYVSTDSGASWKATGATNDDWAGVAVSADGTRLAAAAPYDKIYVSGDSGATWISISNSPAAYWTSLDLPAGGALLIAASSEDPGVADGSIYTATLALNEVWTKTGAPGAYWTSIASSSDGAQWIAAASGLYSSGGVFLSTNSGATWSATPLSAAAQWQSVASSTNGATLIAAANYADANSNPGFVYASTNSGASWFQTSLPAEPWESVAASADGTRLTAVSQYDIYTSSDSGATWQARTPFLNLDLFISVASSADGQRLLVAASNGDLLQSADGGTNWMSPPGAPQTNWVAAASSADGSTLVAAAIGGYDANYNQLPGPIYVSTNSGANWIQAGAPQEVWSSVTVSPDGGQLAAVVGGQTESALGMIYVSTNSGATWTVDGAPQAYWTGIAWANGTLTAVQWQDSSGNTGSIYQEQTGGRTLQVQNWNDIFPPLTGWQALAASADGTQLIAAINHDVVTNAGWLELSTDSGADWTMANAPYEFWVSVASSANGTTMAAAANSDPTGAHNTGRIYVSSDSGATWTQTPAPGQDWEDIASSADGAELTAAVFGGGIYLSANSGTNWTQTSAPSLGWGALAMSADGVTLVAAANEDASLSGPAGIYVSTNSGASWAQTTAPLAYWLDVASSADGKILLAAANEDASGNAGSIYLSTDGGLTWTPTTAPSAYWQSVCMSAGGTTMVAGSSDLGVYVSTDLGATWTQNGSTGLNGDASLSVACSQDGTTLAALGAGGIFTASGFRQVEFAASPTNGSAPLTVQFTCPATDSSGRAITAWDWDFGDGSSHSDLQNPSHTYVSGGIFTPSLLATNDLGLAVQATGPSTFKVIAPGFAVLHSFSGSDGSDADGNLILSGDTLYGTTYYGGQADKGTVFAVNTNGTGFTVLHSFSAESGAAYTNSDGAHPESGLVLADGVLYGTTRHGGGEGDGNVFALQTNGAAFTVLHSFSAETTNSDGVYTNSDGANPIAGLTLSGDTLYGAAHLGGSSGAGTVFAVNTNGAGFTVLHDFVPATDGAHPDGTLVLSGNALYGPAHYGGGADNGTIYAVNTDGSGFRVLHSFSALSGNNNTNSDGANPWATLVLSGNSLYGTANDGGTAGDGTVFTVHTDGTGFVTLYDFTGNDGDAPYGSLILSGGILYGTTDWGGSVGDGTLFALHGDGTGFQSLYSFIGSGDGSGLFGGLVLSDNTLFGITKYDGSLGSGTVFGFVVPPSAGAPQLAIYAAGPDLILDWPTNASGFALQQNSDLTGTNWTDVTSAPNLVNGQNQVILPAGAAARFYRLRQ